MRPMTWTGAGTGPDLTGDTVAHRPCEQGLGGEARLRPLSSEHIGFVRWRRGRFGAEGGRRTH